VDGKHGPISHFGVVLDMKTFKEFSERLIRKNVRFVIEPYIRFEGQAGEQATMFFEDPSGNALEFKAFHDLTQLFAK
jgi:extradiol dioxygenase family protein